jgi:regulatory protein
MSSSQPDAVEAAKERLLKLLGTREHSRAELARKLAQKGVPPAVIDMALDWAAAQGYLDEQRFAAAYSDELSRKGYGPRAIQKKLRDKGVRVEASEEPEDPEALRQQAVELVRRRHGEPESLEPAVKLKAARFLLNRGYSHATIREVLGPLPRA